MSFSIFGLSDEIIRAVTECGYINPTPIQLQAIPAVSGGWRSAGLMLTPPIITIELNFRYLP